MRSFLNWFLASVALLSGSSAAQAQEHPAKRLSSIVGVAVDEYGKAVAPDGRLLSDVEFREAIDFLKDAADVAMRLPGARGDSVRALVDSLIQAVGARRSPTEIAALHARFSAALGTDGVLELPIRAIDMAEGGRIFAASCASCHGALGRGDGPRAAGMTPSPPALGTREAMHEVSPALMYRIVSVGVTGTPMPAWAGKLTSAQRWNVVAYVNAMRATRAQVLEGEGLYFQSCASCHGARGGSDGELARALSTLPPDVGSFAWQAERSDAQIAAVVRNGVTGSAMPASRQLADAEIVKVVAYLRTLATTTPPGDRIAAGDSSGAAVAGTDAGAVSRRVLVLLDDALGAARAGRSSDAGDRAFDAYIAFEPLESKARARSPGLVATMERHFADFKGAVKGNDLRGAEHSRNAIDAGLPNIVELTRAETGNWGAFLQSFLIIVREGFEAILVVGAVVAFLLKTGHRDRLRAIWIGVALALVASAATAVVLATVLRAVPASREIIEGITMLVAVAVLFSVSYWLISKVEAARWQQFIREKVNVALSHGGGRALGIVAFLAVYREGAETALFYQALFQEGRAVALPLSLGILIGFVVLAVIFTMFYRYGVRIPMRPFFAVTSGLLYYMAFVFMGKGVRELQEGNVVPITVIPGFPHVNAMGIFPSVETVLAQLLLLVLFLFALAKTFWPRRSVTLPTVQPAPAPLAAHLESRIATMQAALTELQQRMDEAERVRG